MWAAVKAEASSGKSGVPGRARPDRLFRFSESEQQAVMELGEERDVTYKQLLQTGEMAGKLGFPEDALLVPV